MKAASIRGCGPPSRRFPERQRQMVFLRYYAGLDYATIAEALEVSAGTVAATLSSARSALRHVFEEVPR